MTTQHISGGGGGKRTIPYLTRFERAALIAQRAEQISEGALVTFRIDERHQAMNPVEIAMEELRRKTIPFYVLRPLPDGSTERWAVRDFVNV